jgi:hypothetical protein
MYVYSIDYYDVTYIILWSIIHNYICLFVDQTHFLLTLLALLLDTKCIFYVLHYLSCPKKLFYATIHVVKNIYLEIYILDIIINCKVTFINIIYYIIYNIVIFVYTTCNIIVFCSWRSPWWLNLRPSLQTEKTIMLEIFPFKEKYLPF